MIETLPKSHQSKSIQELKPKIAFSSIAKFLVAFLLAVVIIHMFLPWQQTVVGSGQVTVFSPTERPQTLEAQISGRLKAVLVKEGDFVKKDQVIAELQDIDPKFTGPDQLEQLLEQKSALETRKAAAESRYNALMQQQSALLASQNAAVPGAVTKTEQSRNRLQAAEQAFLASQQNLKTNQLNFDRVKVLFDQGLRSRRDFELAELSIVQAKTDLERVKASLDVARRDVDVAGFDQNKVLADTSASLASVASSMASAKETLASIQSDLAKMNVEIQNFEVRIQQRQVKAPIDGRVVRMSSFGLGQVVSEGQTLAIISPDTKDQAVELYIRDWDVPLLKVGRQVRLQFAGWPALQFAGWPSIATGTFGGVVSVIDAVDTAGGQYRILVKPDWENIKNGHDDPWPSSAYLRPGSKVTGWIMLDTVPLWFELWRQFNAFPPTVAPPADVTDTKKDSDVYGGPALPESGKTSYPEMKQPKKSKK